jgi:DNA polymerase-3 subunit alpha
MDVPQKEKLAWERELLGVYLSEHPFARFAQHLASNTTAFCGQIEADMAGQTVTVAGMVTSVRQGITKNKRPFATAVLEDLTGSLNVSCWAEVYEQTRGLWAEGSMLLAHGKVRVREDEVQLVCEQAEPYNPEPAEQGPVQPIAKTVTQPQRHKLLITIAQTENTQGDLERLYRLLDIIRCYPGQDEVLLAIDTGDGLVNLEMPGVTTGYCRDLHQQLTGLVGEEGITVGG